MEKFISEPWWLWLMSLATFLVVWLLAVGIAHAGKTEGNPQRQVYTAWGIGLLVHALAVVGFIVWSVAVLYNAQYETDKIAIFEVGFLAFLVIDLSLFVMSHMRQRQLRY